MKKWLWIPISILIVLVICAISYFLVGKLQNYNQLILGDAQSDIIDDLKDELNKYANGGLTQEEIDQQVSDDSTPRAEDQIIQMNVQEFKEGVLFYYTFRDSNGNVLYPNLFFRKVNNALCVDGIFNTTFSCKKQGFLGLAERDLSKGSFTINFNKIPNYEYDRWNDSNNIASLSDNNIYCWENYGHSRLTWTPSEKQYRTFGSMLSSKIAEIYRDYFAHLGNLSMIDAPEGNAEVFKSLNTLYTYLYNSCKNENHKAQTKIVNISNLMVYYIPDNEKTNYPIPEDKQAEYGDKEYYDLFVCEKYAECNYSYNNTKIKSSDLSDEYKNNHEYNEVQPSPIEYANLTIQFVNGNNANLGGINFAENPITITFNDNTQTKTITFTKQSDILYGKSLVLESNKSYAYSIVSNVLMFENMSGSFEIKNSNNILKLTFQYIPNSVVLTVGLNLIGSVDYNQLDLTQHPVVINLNNDNHTYTFTFDTNKSIETYKSQIVSLGTYNYTILSDQLVFATTSGTIEITTENRVMLFNCGFVGVNEGFDIKVTSEEVSGQVPSDKFNLLFNNTIFESLNTENYYLSVYIYDNEGQILDHDFTNIGIEKLISGQVTNVGHIASKDSFSKGQCYTVQVAIRSISDNLVYYSKPYEFIFKGNCNITIENFNIGGK